MGNAAGPSRQQEASHQEPRHTPLQLHATPTTSGEILAKRKAAMLNSTSNAGAALSMRISFCRTSVLAAVHQSSFSSMCISVCFFPAKGHAVNMPEAGEPERIHNFTF